MSKSTDNFRIANPIHFLALGFGSGLLPKAPGTFGTLAAIPLYLLLSPSSMSIYLAVVIVMSIAGIYICGKAADSLLGLANVECQTTENNAWWETISKQEQLINCPQMSPQEAKKKYWKIFTDQWRLKINDCSSKLRTYAQMKFNLQYENYLSDVKIGPHRMALTRIRTSSHNLTVETGRYVRPKIPIEERLCTECGMLEDERHFLLKCSRYDNERDYLWNKVNDLCPNFITLSDHDKFIYLMTAEREVACATAKFCHLALEKRRNSMYPPLCPLP